MSQLKAAASDGIVVCVCCDNPMHAAWQEPLVPGRTGYMLITCATPGCPMIGFTFAAPNYPPQDLSMYILCEEGNVSS